MKGAVDFQARARGVFHVLVEDAASARRVLEQAELTVRGEREILVVDVEDYPGVIGDVTRHIARQGVNIDLIYMATNTRLVIGADDLGRARTAL